MTALSCRSSRSTTDLLPVPGLEMEMVLYNAGIRLEFPGNISDHRGFRDLNQIGEM